MLDLSDPDIVRPDTPRPGTDAAELQAIMDMPGYPEMPTIYCPQVCEDLFCLGDHPASCIDAIFPIFPNCGCTFPTNAHCILCWSKGLEKVAEGEPAKCWKCGKPHESACGVLRHN